MADLANTCSTDDKGSQLLRKVLLQTDRRQHSRKTGKVYKEGFSAEQVYLS